MKREGKANKCRKTEELWTLGIQMEMIMAPVIFEQSGNRFSFYVVHFSPAGGVGGVGELVSGSVIVTTGECFSRDNFLSTGLDDFVTGLST